MHDVGKPKSWITWQVRMDAFKFRQADLTGEAQYHLVTTSKAQTSGNTRAGRSGAGCR